MSREVILYTRRNCSLCDEAGAELTALSRELSFELREVDIDEETALHAEYDEIVPVVTVGDRVIAHAPMEPGTLRDALNDAFA